MSGKVIFLTTDSMGDGDRELGTRLLESFLTLLTQREPERLPIAIFCVNRGVLALTDESPAASHLNELAQRGVSVLACKTCTEHYGVSDRLTAGRLSGMETFIELAERYSVWTIA